MRLIAGLIGWILLIAGIVIMVLPTPFGFVLVIAGLTLLAGSYPWAARLLDRMKARFARRPQNARRAEKRTAEDG